MVILNYWACSVVNSALIGSLFKPSKKGSFALHDATLTLVFFNPFFLKDFEYDLNGKELSAQETLEVKVKDWEKIGPNRWVKRYHRLRLLQP